MKMRSNVWMAALVAAACLGSTGCWYQRPDIEDWYEDVEIGWEKQQIVDKLGRPTVMIENDMMYLYDDPEDPVRLRFVLDEDEKVVEKYYESKEELVKRLEEAQRRVPPSNSCRAKRNEVTPVRRWNDLRKSPASPAHDKSRRRPRSADSVAESALLFLRRRF